MAEVVRYDVPWGIPNAGPSVSVFHMSGTATQSAIQGTVAAIAAFFNAIKQYLPNEVTVGSSPTYSILNVESGQLVGTGSVDQPANVTGTGNGVWAAGSGVRVQWLTDQVANGRKIVGSMYLVPFVTNAYTSEGTVTQGCRGDVGAAAATLLDTAGINAPLVVFTRPAPAKQGDVNVVLRHAVPATVATLRKRKY